MFLIAVSIAPLPGVTGVKAASGVAAVEKETTPTLSPEIAGTGFEPGVIGSQRSRKLRAAHCNASIRSGLGFSVEQKLPCGPVKGVNMLPDLSSTMETLRVGLSVAHARVGCGNPSASAPRLGWTIFS